MGGHDFIQMGREPGSLTPATDHVTVQWQAIGRNMVSGVTFFLRHSVATSR